MIKEMKENSFDKEKLIRFELCLNIMKYSEEQNKTKNLKQKKNSKRFALLQINAERKDTCHEYACYF